MNYNTGPALAERLRINLSWHNLLLHSTLTVKLSFKKRTPRRLSPNHGPCHQIGQNGFRWRSGDSRHLLRCDAEEHICPDRPNDDAPLQYQAIPAVQPQQESHYARRLHEERTPKPDKARTLREGRGASQGVLRRCMGRSWCVENDSRAFTYLPKNQDIPPSVSFSSANTSIPKPRTSFGSPKS